MLSVATALEQGRYQGPLARILAKAWTPVAERSLVRHLEFPRHVRVVAIGGATLGGSGKTPLAIACAAELAACGARVALVGHAYRSRPGRARMVRPEDPVGEVGDEALIASHALGPAGVPVVVAPTRSEAVGLAARNADILILDGVAQTSPVRASLALLAVDASEPWGRPCAVAPRGDLRAPTSALFEACDAVVAIGQAMCGLAAPDRHVPRLPEGTLRAWVVSDGARVGGALGRWEDLAGSRVGLLCALARPERVVRSLASRGIALRAVVRAPDHGPLGTKLLVQAARARIDARVDLWLATSKCALHISAATAGDAERHPHLFAPVATIEHALVLSEPMRERLRFHTLP